jgi:hypothetical protein
MTSRAAGSAWTAMRELTELERIVTALAGG